MEKQTGKKAGVYDTICERKNVKAQRCKNVKAQMFVYAFALLFTCESMSVSKCLRA